MAIFYKDPEVGTCVSCRTCSCEIPLPAALRLPREFAVLCPNCGRRSVYRPADAHDAKRDTPRTFARMQFSTGKKKAVQPKSWLNKWASALHR
jgi:hypothetical protein